MFYRFIVLCSFILQVVTSLDIIQLDIRSVLPGYEAFQASSQKPEPELLPVVYLPLTLSVGVNLDHADSNSFVKKELGSGQANLSHWKLCFQVPHQHGPDCRSLTSGERLPNLHGLHGGSVNVVSAWIEYHEPYKPPADVSFNSENVLIIGPKESIQRYAHVSVAFYVEEPHDKGVWFSHITGGGELSLPEQYAILSGSFLRSSRMRFGPGNDSVDFEDGEKYSYTTEYKLRHDIEQLEVDIYTHIHIYISL
jgi:hypothetical protein